MNTTLPIRKLRNLLSRTEQVRRDTGSMRAAARYLGRSVNIKIRTSVIQRWTFARYVPIRHRTGVPQQTDGASPAASLAIAIHVSGGIGDLIVIARAVRDLMDKVGPISFDVYCPTPAIATWIFRHVPGFLSALPNSLSGRTDGYYDLHLHMNQTVVVRYEAMDFSRLRQNPDMTSIVGHISNVRLRGRYDPYIQNHPYLDNSLARKAVFQGLNRLTLLNHFMGIPSGSPLLPIDCDDTLVLRHHLARRRFVTIHNGFDTNFPISGRRATKCYPHFSAVVRILRDIFPDLIFVQIGSTTSEPIDDIDINLISATTLTQAAGLLRSALCHIDNEGR